MLNMREVVIKLNHSFAIVDVSQPVKLRNILEAVYVIIKEFDSEETELTYIDDDNITQILRYDEDVDGKDKIIYITKDCKSKRGISSFYDSQGEVRRCYQIWHDSIMENDICILSIKYLGIQSSVESQREFIRKSEEIRINIEQVIKDRN